MTRALGSVASPVDLSELPVIPNLQRHGLGVGPQPWPSGGPGSTLAFSLPRYQVFWEVCGKNASRLMHTLNSSTHEDKIQGRLSPTTYTIDLAAVTAVGASLTTSSTVSSRVPQVSTCVDFLLPLRDFCHMRGPVCAEATEGLERDG